MTNILVVDDSALDRRLVGGLLGRDPELTVQFANDGAEALEVISRQPPDLVVTDLNMPELDGFELVAAVREQYPLLPVILMTSKGSEQVAVRALREGAASYVPKVSLGRELLATVQQVLSVRAEQQIGARLMDCLTKSEHAFMLDNDASLITPLVVFLQQCATRIGVCGDADRVRIGVALEEALVNALYHGNLELASDLRELDRKEYYDIVEKRRNEPPYRDRLMSVKAAMSRDMARFVVRDQGPGFNPGDVPEADLERVSGRGLLLMRTFMDEVSYNDEGNQVTMVKKRGKG